MYVLAGSSASKSPPSTYYENSRANSGGEEEEEEETYHDCRRDSFIPLTEAQKAMAATILELEKGFSQRRPGSNKGAASKPPPAKKAAVVNTPAAHKPPPLPRKPPSNLPLQVKLREPSQKQDGGSQLGPGSFLTAKYRNISLYDSGQALEEMKRLCNPRSIGDVYNMGKKLGSGSGGTVFMGTHREKGDKRAVKTIDLRGGEKKRHLLMEVLVMKELTHRNLVAFMDIFVSTGLVELGVFVATTASHGYRPISGNFGL